MPWEDRAPLFSIPALGWVWSVDKCLVSNEVVFLVWMLDFQSRCYEGYAHTCRDPLGRWWMYTHLQQLQNEAPSRTIKAEKKIIVDSTCTCFCSRRGRASVRSVIQKDRGAIWEVISDRRREAPSTKRFSPYNRWNSRYFPRKEH